MSELLSKEMQQQLVDRIVYEFCERMPYTPYILDSITAGVSESMPDYNDILCAIEYGVKGAAKK